MDAAVQAARQVKDTEYRNKDSEYRWEFPHGFEEKRSKLSAASIVGDLVSAVFSDREVVDVRESGFGDAPQRFAREERLMPRD